MTRSTSREQGPQEFPGQELPSHPALAGTPGPERTGTAQTCPAAATVPATDYITGICKLGCSLKLCLPCREITRTEWCLSRRNTCCFKDCASSLQGETKVTPCLCNPRPLGAGSGEQGWQPLSAHVPPAPPPPPSMPTSGPWATLAKPHAGGHGPAGFLQGAREPGWQARPRSGLARGTYRLAEDHITAVLQAQEAGNGGRTVLHEQEDHRLLGLVAHHGHAVGESRQQRVQGLTPLTWHKGRMPEKVVREAPAQPCHPVHSAPLQEAHSWPRAARLRLCSLRCLRGPARPLSRTAGDSAPNTPDCPLPGR